MAREQSTENKTYRQIVGQERRHHSDRDHRQPNEPVADVVGEEQPCVDLSLREEGQYDEGRQLREEQRDRVDRRCSDIFANHDIKVIRRKREQQLIGPLSAFFGPNTHGDRWDEEQHDIGEPLVQLS